MTIQDKKCHVGVDVSKHCLDVFILPLKKYVQFSNDAKGIKQLIKELTSLQVTSVVMEATGGYEKPLSNALINRNFSVCVVNPRQIRDFAKALGKLAKTDKVDAQVIALFAEKIEPRPLIKCSREQDDLVQQHTRRRQLVDMITMEKNRLDKVNNGVKRSIQHIIKTLEKELAKIGGHIAKLIQADPQFADKAALLSTVKGVGAITAAGLVADLPELGMLTAKQITALAGLAPFNRDSGAMRGKRAIWGGRASVRCALYMPTLVAVKHNPQLRTFYERLCQSGKAKKVALIACMHKLIIILNAMVKGNQPWHYCEQN